jgi:hypothetical protein
VGKGGVLLVHSEIFYVPVDDGWEEVLVRNELHYVTISGYKQLQRARELVTRPGLMIRLCLQNL